MGSIWPSDVVLKMISTSPEGSFCIAKEHSSGAYFCDYAESERKSFIA